MKLSLSAVRQILTGQGLKVNVFLKKTLKFFKILENSLKKLENSLEYFKILTGQGLKVNVL